jgi:uncharacterized membrane protein YphA (DoxX/SURF4 family)
MINKIISVAAVLLGLLMMTFGLNKFLNFIPMPSPSAEELNIFSAFMTLKWVLPLVAAAEITGGLLVIIQRFRALGAIVLLPVMVGIILQHLVHAPATIGLPFALLIINIAIICTNYRKYLPMVRR